ncbi:TPA: immunoglobulin-like domain-containing protein [Enterococcus faecalis]|nr:hypothetical protein [Enterococcus faecalis]HBI1773128.1 hypothetical protein [Enterococcus faecalis]HBI1794813.1 hypothetical protein [Enterococcus faecalis]HBI1800666.1 hypothetical protein [Enterococcus faecalis]HBI1803293.1 hypothetical protein [Enterococcus faecalis]
MKQKKITYLVLSGLLTNTLLSTISVFAESETEFNNKLEVTAGNSNVNERDFNGISELQNTKEKPTSESVSTSKNMDASLVEYIDNYIQSISYDEIIEIYGGRLTMEQAYASNEMLLNDLQKGDNRSMDSLQLEESFLLIKSKSKETAEKIVQPFIDNEDFEKVLKERINEVVFYYTYTQRWFNYEIGQTSVSDIMFGQLDLFADHEETNLEMLVNILDTIIHDPWPNVPGKPKAMAYFMYQLFFDGSHGMVGMNKGFSREELKNEDGNYSIVSMIEFLIDIYGEGISYDEWLNQLGFVIAEPNVSEEVEIELAGYSLWQLLKNAELSSVNSVSPAFASILFSVPKKDAILLTGTTNYFVVGNATKYPDLNKKEPQQVVDRYEKTLSTIIKFFWENGTDDVREELKKDKSTTYIFDAGEWDGDNKDVHSLDSPYLHYLMQAASPKSTALYLTSTNHNAIVMQGNILFGMGDMYSEYTLIHEVEHTLRGKIYSSNTRMHSENTARLVEADYVDVGALTLNIGYNDTEYGVWNQRVPENSQELKNYANNILDLTYVLNYIKAKEVFSLPIEDQVGHVQRMQYNSGQVVAEWLTLEDLKELNLNPEDSQFIEKLVTNKIFLPSKYDNKLSNNNSPFIREDMPEYTSLGLRRDSYFYIPYTGNDFMKNHGTNSAYGFNHYWWFESLATNAWAGAMTFNLGDIQNDMSALQAVGVANPDQHIINRYKRVKEKLRGNQLILDTEEELHIAFKDNLKNDAKLRDDLITKYQKNSQELMFNSIFEDPDNILKAPLVDIVYEGDTKVLVENQSEGKIKIETSDGTIIGQSDDEKIGEVEVYIAPQKADEVLYVYTVNQKGQSSEKTEVLVLKKEVADTEFTMDKYFYGQINITGSYSDDIKRARLKVNDEVVSFGGDFKDSHFTYYVGAGRIREQDTAVLEALDEKDQVVAELPINPIKQETGIKKAEYVLGNQIISGVTSKETKRARLIVNGIVISQGGTFNNDLFSYYVNQNSIREGDSVLLQGYDNQDKPLGLPIEVEVHKNSGEITNIKYEEKKNTITGKYTGDITRARLTVDGKVISWGGTFKEGIFSYYVSAGLLTNYEEAYLEIFDNGNNLVSKEKYYIE